MLIGQLDPTDFYHLAKELHESENLKSKDVAIERTIIDRIYYSVFLAYRKFLSNNKKFDFVPLRNGGDHKRVIKHIKEKDVFGKESYTISAMIKDMREYRGDASYNLVGTNPFTSLGKMEIEDLFADSEILFKKIGIEI